MPADHSLRSNDDEMVLPSWPESRERDLEDSIQRRESWPGAFLGIDRELLAEGKLDGRLVLATSEEGEGAVEKGE